MQTDVWRKEYERSRYLRNITDALLEGRLRDLAANLWSTDADGNIIPPRDPKRRQGLLRLVLHVMLEQMERTGTPHRMLDEAALRAEASASFSRPTLTAPFVAPPGCICKFGARGHIAKALNEGILRIAAASSYNDPSLNEAQRDDELAHFTITPNQQLLMQIGGLDADGREVELPFQPLELFRGIRLSDFYVWCCGLGYDARLFHDFGKCDAALVIRDPKAFSVRLAAAVAMTLPDGTQRERGLRYYDPYTPDPHPIIPLFSKHFRYAYQNEYRFVWRAGDSSKPLACFFPRLGPLHDIAFMIELA